METKTITLTDASKRPINEPSAHVTNPSNADSDQKKNGDKTPPKKSYHTDYSDVKNSAKGLFEKFDQSGVFHTVKWNIGEPLSMFVKHEIFFKQHYTEVKFKQDYAAEMAGLLSDLRIVRAVRAAQLNLFETVQVMVWETASVKNNIHKLGIKNVNAFAKGLSWARKEDLQVFSMEELAPYFHDLGLEDEDFNKDWSRKNNDAGVEGDAPAA